MNSSINFFSDEWYGDLADNMRENRALFEPLGSIDCTMVIEVGDPPKQDLIEVKFKSYEVASVRRLTTLDDAEPNHFVVTATRETWREMFDNIIGNGHPDLEHTLNFLTFPDDPMVVDGPDQLQIDAFYRYNQSLQLFFNGAAAVAGRSAV
jgi:hypothetical protein